MKLNPLKIQFTDIQTLPSKTFIGATFTDPIRQQYHYTLSSYMHNRDSH